MSWFVYILECSDKTLYTGITNNLEKRLDAHNSGTGSKYTRGRGPVKLVFSELQENRSTASRREIEIKSLSKFEKNGLISNYFAC